MLKPQARTLFVKDGLSISEISLTLNLAITTVYSWRREDSGSSMDWDRVRASYNLSPREMVGQYAQQVRELLLDLSEHPEKMANANTADALAKHIANLRKLNPKHLYMGAIVDLMEQTDKYLAQHDNALRTHINAHWPSIRQQIRALLEQEVPLV